MLIIFQLEYVTVLVVIFVDSGAWKMELKDAIGRILEMTLDLKVIRGLNQLYYEKYENLLLVMKLACLDIKFKMALILLITTQSILKQNSILEKLLFIKN